MKKHLVNTSLAMLSGVMGFLAFPPFDIAPMAWVCLVPLFFAVRNSSPWRSFGYAYISGAVFFGGLLSWLVNVSIPGMIVLVLVLASIYGIFGLIARYVLDRSADVLILPFVWVVLEYVRGVLFTGFPWGILAYSQYKNIELIQIADITGAYGVSFLLVAFNATVFAWATRSSKKAYGMIAALLFLILAISYGTYRTKERPAWDSLNVSVVQGNIPQSEKWDSSFARDITEKYDALSREAAADDTSMIIWPETAYPYLVDGDAPSVPEISAIASETGIPILAGIVSSSGGRYYNSAVLFGAGGEVDSIYDKVHLVPFGEYIPFEKYMPFLREHIDKPIGRFGHGDEYKLFSLKTSSESVSDGIRRRQISFHKFGVMICFEDIFPYMARQFSRAGADFLVNITNDAWFGKTAASRQHMQASVFRAVENRRPVIRAANTGISCFIDTAGRVFSKVESGGEEIFVRGFDTGKLDLFGGRKTYYTSYGDVFAGFCAFMAAFLLFFDRYLRRRRGRG